MFSRLETGRYWVSSPALAAYMAKPTFGAVFTVPVAPIEFDADYWTVTHQCSSFGRGDCGSRYRRPLAWWSPRT